MFKTIQKIWDLLNIGEQKKLYWLISAIVIMAVLDIVGIASIFPFLSVMSNPEVIQTNSKLQWLYEHMGFVSENAFLIALAGVTFVILVVNNVLRAGISVLLIRFTWLKRYFISKQLLSQYLYEPYEFFLNRNSSKLTAHLVSEVARVVSGILLPSMQVFARFLLALLILALLVMVDPIVAMVSTVVIGGGYVAIYIFARNKLLRSGKNIQLYSEQMYKVLNEAFGGIKDIKLLGKENFFIKGYSVPVKKTAGCYSEQYLIAQVPRYAFEILAFGGILIITVYLVVVKKDYQQVIPLVGLYAFAAYRLMPTLQQIFADLAAIRFNCSALETIHGEFFHCAHASPETRAESAAVLPFVKNVELRNVAFQYPKSKRHVIENLNLTINANTTVGFVGGTGAGKTTVIDILLGLLRPGQGEIIIDGIKLEDTNLCMWQKNIGYVSQHIYLSDDTVVRNIAFGIEDSKIDQQAVERAAQLANIHDFIKNELPSGYETEVGERGVRLSGGQKQRIGIARALYHNPSLIVFDEATSALDGITEDAILEAIHNLGHKKTIVIIAHRFSTVQECDIIYMLERGQIVDQGTYQELLENNEQFRKMSKTSFDDNKFSKSFADVPE